MDTGLAAAGALRARGDRPGPPTTSELAEQFCSFRYRVYSRGKTQIESKEEMLGRVIASPGRADALMLCFAGPAIERIWLIVQEQPRVRISPY